jgi:hypothetical protein
LSKIALLTQMMTNHVVVVACAGYSWGTVISHNEVYNTTWCGISVGYGWSRHPNSYAGNVTVTYNRVHDYKKTLHDGGGECTP